MAPRFALLVLLLSLLPLVLPHSIRLPSAPCAARIAARSLEGRGVHRVLRTSIRVTCRADILRPRHSVDAHVACGETSATRTGSRGLNVNDGETERGRAVRGDEEWHTDGCRAVPEQRADLSSCTTADEHMGSSGAAGRTRVTIRLEQPIPRGLYADPFELERILRPAGDRAWVVGPVELEQPAPRCEATVAVMERDVHVGEGERKGEGGGAGGKVRKGEGAGDEEGRGEGEGDMRVGEDEVAFSLEFSLPLHSRYPAVQPALSPPLSPLSLPWDLKQLQATLQRNHSFLSSLSSLFSLSTLTSLTQALTGSCSQSYAAIHVPLPSACLVLPPPPTSPADGETDGSGGAARLGGDSEGDEAEQRHEEVRRETEEGALVWEVPAGCAAHTPLVLWGTSLAAAVGALVLVAAAAAAPVHTAGAKASS
ncbi:unnamed protein product [Closterium sp. Naga37s-1]|nr:unnamed protein product [Closterium sp. Naga37s-1]